MKAQITNYRSPLTSWSSAPQPILSGLLVRAVADKLEPDPSLLPIALFETA